MDKFLPSSLLSEAPSFRSSKRLEEGAQGKKKKEGLSSDVREMDYKGERCRRGR